MDNIQAYKEEARHSCIYSALLSEFYVEVNNSFVKSKS